jgi:hypothetical protein
MATPKERNDERQRERAAREARDTIPDPPSDPGDQAQQQGDGQPENARELEDRASGSSQARSTPDD